MSIVRLSIVSTKNSSSDAYSRTINNSQVRSIWHRYDWLISIVFLCAVMRAVKFSISPCYTTTLVALDLASFRLAVIVTSISKFHCQL